MDTLHLRHSTNVHITLDADISEHLNSIVMGNHEELEGVNEISTNYIDSRESLNRKITIIDILFLLKIDKNLEVNPAAKTVAECLMHSG